MHRPFVSSLLGALILLSALSVQAKPNVPVTYKELDGYLFFEIHSDPDEAPITQRDVKHFLAEDDLLKIEVQRISIKKGTWLQTFTQKKQDPDIKGILLKSIKSGGVQIRTRFKKKMPRQLIKLIKFDTSSSNLVIKVPRSVPVPLETRSKPPVTKHTGSSHKVQALSNSLRENTKSSSKNTPIPSLNSPSLNTKPKTTTSQFDRSQASSPLPPVEQMRHVPPSATETPKTLTSPNVSAVSSIRIPPTVGTANPRSTVTPSVFKPSKNQTNRLNLRNKTPIQEDRKQQRLTTKPPSNVSSSQTNNDSSITGLSGMNSDVFPPWMLILTACIFFGVGILLFMKARTRNKDDHGENSIRVIAEKVVNYRPVQRILLVEVLDQTIVVGSSENGGLTFLSQINPKSQPVDIYPSHNEYSREYPAVSSPSNSIPPSPYDEHSVLSINSTQQPMKPSLDARSNDRGYGYQNAMHVYDEHTYVNEEEPYTSEIPVASVDGARRTLDRPLGDLAFGDANYVRDDSNYSQNEYGQPSHNTQNEYGPDSSGFSDLNPLVDDVKDGAYQSASTPNVSPSPEEEEDVSADDLLQKIRQLNRG